MKVALIGGGSTYTPQLVNGFLARVKQLPVSELWLMDIDAARLVALQAPPVAGAVLLGMEAAGLAATIAGMIDHESQKAKINRNALR